MRTVVETPSYLRSADKAGMTEAERAEAVDFLSESPTAGVIIQGTGGCRKVRVAKTGHGKSGGYRVVTYVYIDGRVFLLFALSKTQKANLTQSDRNALYTFVKSMF